MYEVRYINYLYAMAMFSDDPILKLLFSSRQKISNHFALILICLAAGCFAYTNGVTIFDLVSSSSFGDYYKAETFPLMKIILKANAGR